jgi:MFS family permease
LTNHILSQDNEKKQSRFFYGYLIVISAFLIFFISGGSQYSFSVFFKPMLNEFGWSRAAISGAYSLNMILSGMMGIVAGRICDKLGPKIVLTVSGTFMGVGYLLMSQIQSIWQIYLFFGVIVSIGLSGMTIPLLSSVARWFSKRRSLTSGIVLTGSGFGIIIMPPLANWFISTYNWRNSYIVLGLIVIALVVTLAQFMRRSPNVYRSLTPEAKLLVTKASNVQLQGLSIGEAIRTWQFWIIFMITLFIGFSVQTIMVHVVAHATDINITAAAAALILSVIGIISICGKLAMGGLGDKTGNRYIVIIVSVLAILAFLWLRFAGELWMLYLFAVFFGLYYGGYAAIQSPLVAEYFGLKDHGAIFGLVMFALGIGSSIGPLIAGRIFDVSGNYDWAFVVCGFMGISILILSILLKPVKKKMVSRPDI